MKDARSKATSKTQVHTYWMMTTASYRWEIHRNIAQLLILKLLDVEVFSLKWYFLWFDGLFYAVKICDKVFFLSYTTNMFDLDTCGNKYELYGITSNALSYFAQMLIWNMWLWRPTAQWSLYNMLSFSIYTLYIKWDRVTYFKVMLSSQVPRFSVTLYCKSWKFSARSDKFN